MNKLVLILALLISISVNGQETIKQKTKSLNGNSVEKYDVLKSDMKIKHGDYQRYCRSRLVAEGTYNFGVKEVFKYYSFDETPFLVYDYSKNEVLSYAEDLKSVEVYSEFGEEIAVDRPPLALFSGYELGWFIASNLNYPVEAQENGQSGKVQILVSIDEKGKVINYRLFLGFNEFLNEEALRVVNLIPKEWNWLPAIKDDQPIKSALVFPVNFVLQ